MKLKEFLCGLRSPMGHTFVTDEVRFECDKIVYYCHCTNCKKKQSFIENDIFYRKDD